MVGRIRAQCGNAAEGIQLIQLSKAVLLDARPGWWERSLAIAQECAGAFADALENVERSIERDRAAERLVVTPEALRVRGELRLKLGQTTAARS